MYILQEAHILHNQKLKLSSQNWIMSSFWKNVPHFSRQIMIPDCLIWEPGSHLWHLCFFSRPPHPKSFTQFFPTQLQNLSCILPFHFFQLKSSHLFPRTTTIAFLLVLTLLWLPTRFLCVAASKFLKEWVTWLLKTIHWLPVALELRSFFLFLLQAVFSAQTTRSALVCSALLIYQLSAFLGGVPWLPRLKEFLTLLSHCTLFFPLQRLPQFTVTHSRIYICGPDTCPSRSGRT